MKKDSKAGGGGRFAFLLLLLVGLIVVMTCISVTMGAVDISPINVIKIIINKSFGCGIFEMVWDGKAETIIWNIRFPRVLLAFIVGAGLSLCGVLMQALTKNSLADPYVLGISSGASAGAVSVMVLGFFSFLGGYAVIAGATLGAMLSIILSMRIASIRGRITSTQLILAGIATSALFSALTNMIIYGGGASDKTKTALYWMVGSLSGASWSRLRYVSVVFLITVAVISLFAKELDVLLLGDDVAETLGVDTRKLKWVIIITSTVLTGVVVSVSGVIGFIGLVVPHMIRRIAGSGHRQVIPLALLGGGLFAVIADLLSRILIAPEELQIGVISAFFGAPFFLYLIRKGCKAKK